MIIVGSHPREPDSRLLYHKPAAHLKIKMLFPERLTELAASANTQALAHLLVHVLIQPSKTSLYVNLVHSPGCLSTTDRS